MKFTKFPKSPVFPAGHKWHYEKRKDGYESDVTALVRRMLEDQELLEISVCVAPRLQQEVPVEQGAGRGDEGFDRRGAQGRIGHS